jgi:hypothetical protein
VTTKARCIFRKCQVWGNVDAAKNSDKAEKKDHHDNECFICKDGGDLICCDECTRAYHSNCHKPKIWELWDDEWYCMICASMKKALDREDAKVKKLQVKFKEDEVKTKAGNKEKVKREEMEKESKRLFEGEHLDDCFMCYDGGGEYHRVSR